MGLGGNRRAVRETLTPQAALGGGQTRVRCTHANIRTPTAENPSRHTHPCACAFRLSVLIDLYDSGNDDGTRSVETFPPSVGELGSPGGLMAMPLPTRPATVAEVERLVRRIAFKDWSKPEPWGIFSLASTIGGYSTLLLWHAQLCGPDDVAAFVALAGGGYFCSRRACLPSPQAIVDARVIEGIIRSPALTTSFKRACTEAYYRGTFTYRELASLARSHSAD